MNFIDSRAKVWMGGRWADGGVGQVGLGGSKTNVNRFFGVAMTSKSIYTEPG